MEKAIRGKMCFHSMGQTLVPEFISSAFKTIQQSSIMKKLLLLTNAVFISFFAASCQNSQTPKTEIEIVSHPINADTIISQDSTKKEMHTPVSGDAGNEPGIPKDSARNSVKPKAIHHKAPEQEKIDSIKNSKSKNKK